MRLLWLALLLLGCKVDPEDRVECVDDGDCEGLSVCTPQNTCRQVECLDSSQCAVGNHCNLDSYTCFTGCQENEDCLVGQVCDTDTTQCVAGECTDAVVDCYIGQECTDEGACARPEGLCLSCSGTGYTTCTQDYGGTCRYAGSGGYRCLTPCDPVAEAGPREFACEDLSYDDSGDYYWYGDCGLADSTTP